MFRRLRESGPVLQPEFGLRCQVALEYIWMNSHRDVTGSLNPTPDGWQMSVRLRY